MQLINLLTTFLILIFTPMALSQDVGWSSSCPLTFFEGTILHAFCDDGNGEYQNSQLDLNYCIANYGGYLTVCNPPFLCKVRFVRSVLADVSALSLVRSGVSRIHHRSLPPPPVSKLS